MFKCGHTKDEDVSTLDYAAHAQALTRGFVNASYYPKRGTAPHDSLMKSFKTWAEQHYFNSDANE